jgi:hypothetical protein
MTYRTLVPDVKTTIETLDRLRQSNLITGDELRALYRLKTWVREKEDAPTSAAKMKVLPRTIRDRERANA